MPQEKVLKNVEIEIESVFNILTVSYNYSENIKNYNVVFMMVHFREVVEEDVVSELECCGPS